MAPVDHSFEAVDKYLKEELPARRTQLYLDTGEEERPKEIKAALDSILDHYSKDVVSARAVAMQTLFELESQEQGFDLMRRQGISNYKDGNLDVSFAGHTLSPYTVAIIEAELSYNADVNAGRLI